MDGNKWDFLTRCFAPSPGDSVCASLRIDVCTIFKKLRAQYFTHLLLLAPHLSIGSSSLSAQTEIEAYGCPSLPSALAVETLGMGLGLLYSCLCLGIEWSSRVARNQGEVPVLRSSSVVV